MQTVTLIINIWVALIRASFCETHHEILEHLLSWGLWCSTVFYHGYWTQSHCWWQFRVIINHSGKTYGWSFAPLHFILDFTLPWKKDWTLIRWASLSQENYVINIWIWFNNYKQYYSHWPIDKVCDFGPMLMLHKTTLTILPSSKELKV